MAAPYVVLLVVGIVVVVAALIVLPLSPPGDEAQRVPSQGGPVDLSSELHRCGRAILLAFSDLGIYVAAPRDVVVAKVCRDRAIPRSEVERVIDVCIGARLIDGDGLGTLRLSPAEAGRLERSLDGDTPVPEEQAGGWTHDLRAAAASHVRT